MIVKCFDEVLVRFGMILKVFGLCFEWFLMILMKFWYCLDKVLKDVDEVLVMFCICFGYLYKVLVRFWMSLEGFGYVLNDFGRVWLGFG